MTETRNTSRVLAAVDALKRHERHEAVALLNAELQHGPRTGDAWKSISRLASNIREIEIAIEAAHRYAQTPPVTLEKQLFYWRELAANGRLDDVESGISALPEAARRHPAVLHFQATITEQRGDFDAAIAGYRDAIARSPGPAQVESWFALAMLRKFSPGDSDLAAIEALAPHVRSAPPLIAARWHYALGKALQDQGEYDRAFACFSNGAALRRQGERFDADALSSVADRVIRDYTAEGLARLTPSKNDSRRAIFVNGLPRSGTTLAEQILTAHDDVGDGGEINLARAALLPAGDTGLEAALAYQQRSASEDPWGAIADDYLRLCTMLFGDSGRFVDKTLLQSHIAGLLLHSLPEAKMIWMRRDPEDCAISCFTTYFTEPVPWSWSLEDIARLFAIEDRLHAHWRALFPERILTVSYEALARDPEQWVPRMAAHVGLSMDSAMLEPHRNSRTVRTASVQQVRSAIGTGRIGMSQQYDEQLAAFRTIYGG
ncbi:tetratricopeptide repeat-containing sulfotransferase family protein [Stakelama tenebrarum]|uniref:Sulfotransferase family protein n=1 Tax=Stakelama tenebrarum TaxID=2711215 RepID=A0A6G6Y924_9SPHN|nr:tetratricopeptide repeat-containing sulfotransferase family protein [Sphingosinithalassobacter tenebrarum]QIG81419.1 hypothetical protein G5C33_17570 [Sphingosinithalassobacter tenebrarum]